MLHLSDLHLTPGQTRKQEWLRGLADLRARPGRSTPATTWPTATPSPSSASALGPLLDVPGVFVFGSNDYYSPTLRNPLRYLLPDDGQRNTHTPAAAVARTCATRSPRPAGSTSPTAATR